MSAAAAAAARKRHWSQSEATPRWFGFDTKTCGIMPFKANVHEDEVIAFAAYDLESGDAYTALINPALHNPRYKYRAGYHGEPGCLHMRYKLYAAADAAAYTCSQPACGCSLPLLLPHQH
jgi:hypothetical protein